MIRIGNSIDCHKLVFGEYFMLGGVKIPGFKVIANSDGDCLYHVIAESILGSLGLGSLGEHFDEMSDQFNDIDSSYFVKYAMDKLKEQGFKVSNIDLMIMLDSPKLKEYLITMKENIARLLEIEEAFVSVKPTTLEGVSPLSQMAITCMASVLITNE